MINILLIIFLQIDLMLNKQKHTQVDGYYSEEELDLDSDELDLSFLDEDDEE